QIAQLLQQVGLAASGLFDRQPVSAADGLAVRGGLDQQPLMRRQHAVEQRVDAARQFGAGGGAESGLGDHRRRGLIHAETPWLRFNRSWVTRSTTPQCERFTMSRATLASISERNCFSPCEGPRGGGVSSLPRSCLRMGSIRDEAMNCWAV